jgi:GT2 family glycosyltransferase
VTSDPSVAVVIPSWNSERLLPRCFDSLEAQDLPLEGLLVVDNGSTDGTLELLARREIEHVPLPSNIGFAAAVNLGVARVDAPAVLILNADTVLEPGCVGALSAALAADSGLGGVQPRLLQLEDGPHNPATARLYSAGMALTADGRAFEQGTGGPQGPLSASRREVFGVCGAACLLRRELFDQLGGYDERYFAFYEDVDLNVRARIAGWRFGYVPEAVVWHIGNASWMEGFDRPAPENARLVARNRLATQVKFMPPRSLPRIVAVEAGALGRAATQRRLWATLRGKLEALRWMPALLRDRRALAASGSLGRAQAWLGRETAG